MNNRTPCRINKTLRRSVLALSLLAARSLLALGEPSYIETSSSSDGALIADGEQVARIYVDSGDHWGTRRAADDLAADVERVTGRRPQVVESADKLGEHAIIVGTVGRSALIDQLAKEGKIDASGIAGKWEGYHIEVIDAPFEGVKKALVIAGSDMRGGIFGVYDLSEHIGVSPWHWWADVPASKADALYAKAGTRIQDAPKVTYRGIFLNDEAPALTGWVRENYGDYNSKFYVHVFELLLRLKSNFLWPAMWGNAFADDDVQNMILADKYGIVMSTSHHEPMMRADKEWDRHGEGPWDYARNPKRLYEFWKDGATRNKPHESIYTLGMRGQQDTPMSATQNIDLLELIVKDQREILSDVFDDRPIEKVPQVWALYKEVQGYYESGMRVPDDVILLWCDDNWGNIRRLPTPEERKRVGGAGVYYHFDYVGGPRSYRWINTIPLAKIWEQMNLAAAYDANKIWLTNVGDLKPMEFPIEFFLDLAWDISDWPKDRIREYGQLWAGRAFGAEHAEEIEALLTGYTRHNGRRKPEAQDASTYSQLHYREADRVIAEMDDLVARAEALYSKLDDSRKDAFFQLVLYPVKASAVITKLYDAQARNHRYGMQARASANKWGEKTKALFEENAALAKIYHTEIAEGKWNHMMSQPRIGYVYWANPEADTMPPVMDYEPHERSEMGISVEGIHAAWPQEGVRYALPTFHTYGQKEYYLDIFNKGSEPFEFSIAAAHPWVKLSETEGTVEDERRIVVSVDWAQLPDGPASSGLEIKGPSWGSARIGVAAVKQGGDVSGFIEADGYVSIEAARYSSKRDVEGSAWEEIELHGRTDSSISVFPVSDRIFENASDAPFVEYELTLFSEGPVTVEALFAPSLPFAPGRGIRYGIAFDDQKPQIVDIVADMGDAAWADSVLHGVRKSRTQHLIKQPGRHTLRIYMVDPAATLQKIVIDTGGLKPSYLGPQGSLHAADLL